MRVGSQIMDQIIFFFEKKIIIILKVSSMVSYYLGILYYFSYYVGILYSFLFLNQGKKN